MGVVLYAMLRGTLRCRRQICASGAKPERECRNADGPGFCSTTALLPKRCSGTVCSCGTMDGVAPPRSGSRSGATGVDRLAPRFHALSNAQNVFIISCSTRNALKTRSTRSTTPRTLLETPPPTQVDVRGLHGHRGVRAGVALRAGRRPRARHPTGGTRRWRRRAPGQCIMSLGPLALGREHQQDAQLHPGHAVA